MGIVGTSQQRVDALAKARGEHIYPSDHKLPDMLWLRIVRATERHALLKNVDVSRAVAQEGVACVLTAEDIPGENSFGLIVSDQPVLCHDRVRYLGEPIAIVAARDDQTARRAAKLVQVEYALLDTVENAKTADVAIALHDGGNEFASVELGFGSPDELLTKCAHQAEYSYVTNRQEHAFLETEAGTSWIDSEGILTLSVGGQNPFHDQRQVAAALGLPESQIRVLNPMMGGAFGGKEDCSVQIPLALVTWLTGKPARFMFDRRESIQVGVKRHSFDISLRIGSTHDGKLQAFDAALTADAGAYTTLTPPVVGQAAEHLSGPYTYEASRIQARAMFTNNGVASAYRGFGGPQVMIGIEQAIDELSRKCELSPFAFRRKNLIQAGERAAAGHVMTSDTALLQLMDAAEKGDLWSGRKTFIDAAPDQTRRGIGVSTIWQGYGLGARMENGANVHLELRPDGRYRLHVGTPDLGSGNLTAFLQIAADELGTDIEQFEYIAGDSNGPDSGSSHASRTIYVVGNSVAQAGRELATRIKSCFEGETGIVLLRDRVRVGADFVPLSKVYQMLPSATVRRHYCPPSATPISPGIPHAGYGYWVQVLGAEVDLLTGQVTVKEVENYVDTGKTINPICVTGQCEGAFAQGLGYALYENAVYKDSVMLNPTFSNYIIPSIKDLPLKMKTTLFETPDTCNPLGVRGIAEIGLSPVAPSVANAINDAIGVRFHSFPILPEMVQSALVEKEGFDYE